MACMGTAAELTRVDGACAAAGLAGARGPQKSLSFLFPFIQAHLLKIYSLEKRHRVLPKISYVAHVRHRVFRDALVCHFKTPKKRHKMLKKRRVALKRNTGVCVFVCVCSTL